MYGSVYHDPNEPAEATAAGKIVPNDVPEHPEYEARLAEFAGS